MLSASITAMTTHMLIHHMPAALPHGPVIHR